MLLSIDITYDCCAVLYLHTAINSYENNLTPWITIQFSSKSLPQNKKFNTILSSDYCIFLRIYFSSYCYFRKRNPSSKSIMVECSKHTLSFFDLSEWINFMLRPTSLLIWPMYGNVTLIQHDSTPAVNCKIQ